MNQFSINHKSKDDVEVLELKGELDAHTSSHLEDVLKKLIEQERHKIIVNCCNLDYIASAGLGVFMAYIEDVRNLDGDIKLTNMNDKVYDVFDLLGFPTLYDILEDEEDALEKFRNSSQ